MERTSDAVLLLADISGFTQFVRMHAVATTHAREIIVRLLNALVRASGTPLRVAELEGDAVFLYATAPKGELAAVSADVKAQIPRLFEAFNREREALQKVPICVCDACTSIGNLRLKQVVHTGEVAFERIDRFEKLFGIDVIVVHRMLKNSVPAREYLMLTDAAYASFTDFFDQEPERRTEQFEGVGEVATVVFYETQIAQMLARLAELAPLPAPTGRLRVLAWKLGMARRTVAGLIKRTAPSRITPEAADPPAPRRPTPR